MSFIERVATIERAVIPKIFADTSLIAEIRELFDSGIPIDGATTNPMIVATQIGSQNPLEYYKNLLEAFPDLPISIQLLDNKNGNKSVEELVREARVYAGLSNNAIVKVPMLSDRRGLAVLATLSRDGISTNVTALMKKEQVLIALLVGIRAGKAPAFVSLFVNRLRDRATAPKEKPSFNPKIHGSGNPLEEIRKSRDLIDMLGVKTEIIGASIRSGHDVFEAMISGAHIVTIQPKILKEMVGHNKSDEFSVQSTRDFEKATSGSQPNR